MIRFALGCALLLPLAACGRETQRAPDIGTFEAAPQSLAVGEEVRFTWQVEGGRECLLDVDGDGTPDYRFEGCEAGSQRHHYSAPGRFDATLTAIAEDGAARSSTLTGIQVRGAPQATLEATPTSGSAPLTVTFDASASAGEALSFAWSFGDGAQGEGRRVQHTYQGPGRYTVSLRVRDARGAEDTARTTIHVADTERLILFDGSGTQQWEGEGGGPVSWPVVGGALEVNPGRRVGANDIRTKETFQDFRLHVEFWVPRTPPGTPEQARGNSGVYLQGRYEVQVLDSYGRTPSGRDDAGAIYGVKDASENAARPAETWQSYDILFRAARWSDGKKVEDARVTLLWNGVLVHDETRVPSSTRLGDPEEPRGGPIVLQDHGDRVRFRNLWIEPLD